MITTRGTTVVHAAPADVYTLLADPARLAGLARAPGGAPVDIKATVIERVPYERIVVRNEISPFGFAPTRRGRFGRAVTRVERTLQAHPDGTLVTVQTEVRIEPRLLRAYFALVKRGQWQRGTDEGLTRLREAF